MGLWKPETGRGLSVLCILGILGILCILYILYVLTYDCKHNILIIQRKKLCALADHKYINIKSHNRKTMKYYLLHMYVSPFSFSQETNKR
jgi:hypothetical protein